MIQALSLRRFQAPSFWAGVAIALAGAVASIAVAYLAGTKTGFILAVIAIGGPLLIYVALAAPLVFPFGVYVALVPFNNILDFTTFGTLTKTLAILAGAVLVFYLVRTRRVTKPPIALFYWVGLYLWAGTTGFWAIDQQSVYDLLPTGVMLVSLYAVVSFMPATIREVKSVAVAAVVGGFAAATYGAYLFHSGNSIFYGNRLRITTDTNAIDPNHFAAALLLPIALCATTALYTRKWYVALISLGAMLVMLIGVAESASRGAVLGLCAMLLYYFWRGRRRVRLALFTLPALISVAFLNDGALWNRFGQAVDSGGSGRLPIWHVGFNALKAHWLLGAGYNNFPFAYDQAYLATPSLAFMQWHRGSHDLILGTFVELGVVGISLLLLAWYSQFRMLRDVPVDSNEYPLRLALESTIVGTFVAALFLDVMIMKYVWLTFMLGVLLRNANARMPQRA